MNVLATKAKLNGFDFELFDTVTSFIYILKKYAALLKKFQKRETLLSCVIPSLLLLKNSIIKFDPTCDELKEFKRNLLADFSTRCQEIFDPSSLKFSLLYSISTYLDPSVKMLMNLNECHDMKIMVESHLSRLSRVESNSKNISNDYAELFEQLNETPASNQQNELTT